LAILKRRSRMISFRLSEDEYASLRSLCENEGARSVSDLARDAVHRLMQKDSETQVESVLRALEGRMDTLDLQVQRLSVAVGEAPAQLMRHSNGKT
jgi:Arc/MetJ-type ribon-helix-helix transcriptional regulator